MRLAVLWVEWRRFAASRRPWVLGAAACLGVTVPLATGALPRGASNAALTLLFVGWALMGAAIRLRLETERGMPQRIVRAGVSAGSYLLQRAAGDAAFAATQLAPAALTAAVVTGASPARGAWVLGALAFAAWVGALLGGVLGAVSRSRGEAWVSAAVATLLLCHASGALRWEAADAPDGFLASIAPFRGLHQALDGIATGVSTTGAGSLAMWALVLPVVVALTAEPVVRGMQPNPNRRREG